MPGGFGYNPSMDIRRQMAYESARLLLRETLEAHPEAFDHPFQTSGAYHSIGQLVAHLVGAERRWTIGRLYDEGRPPRYEDQAAETLGGVFADWDAIRARTLAFVSSADAETLARIIPVEMPQWSHAVRLTLEEVLFHLCNHQTWHVGQISLALQQRGIDPPNFDYVLLKSTGGDE